MLVITKRPIFILIFAFTLFFAQASDSSTDVSFADIFNFSFIQHVGFGIVENKAAQAYFEGTGAINISPELNLSFCWSKDFFSLSGRSYDYLGIYLYPNKIPDEVDFLYLENYFIIAVDVYFTINNIMKVGLSAGLNIESRLFDTFYPADLCISPFQSIDINYSYDNGLSFMFYQSVYLYFYPQLQKKGYGFDGIRFEGTYNIYYEFLHNFTAKKNIQLSVFDVIYLDMFLNLTENFNFYMTWFSNKLGFKLALNNIFFPIISLYTAFDGDFRDYNSLYIGFNTSIKIIKGFYTISLEYTGASQILNEYFKGWENQVHFIFKIEL